MSARTQHLTFRLCFNARGGKVCFKPDQHAGPCEFVLLSAVKLKLREVPKQKREGR